MPEYSYTGIQESSLHRGGMLRHVRVGKGTVGVRLLMIYLLGMDKAEWIEDIWKESSLESFWA